MFGDCGNSSSTSPGCYFESEFGKLEPNQWLEETVWYGMRMWHVIFLSIGTALSFVILLCCCFKFRIPRTKQEIEGDYIRRKIMRKFRKRLKAIQNQELDEMDLKKALDKIRTELKSDTESLQQSDVLSGTTLSSAAIGNQAGSTYRRASQIQIDISLEDLRIQSMGLGARIALAFTRFFGKGPKKPSSQEETGTGSGAPEVGGDTPTAALLPKQSDKNDHTASSSDKKTKESNKKGEASSSPEDPNKKSTKSKEKTKEKSSTKEEKVSTETTTRVTMEKETKSKDKTIKGKKEKSTTATETSKESSSKPPSSAKDRENASKSSTEKTKGAAESQKSSGTLTKPPSSTNSKK